MSTRKSKGHKMAPVRSKKKNPPESCNQSTIDSAIFIEGLQQKSGNPLHSTAIEEDLDPPKGKNEVAKKSTQKVKNVVQTAPLKNDQAKLQKVCRQEESVPGARPKKRPNQIVSSDDITDEDTSWHPSAKKTKTKSLGRDPKKLSSPKGARNKSDKVGRDEKKKKRSKGRTELEVVMEAFLDFCDQYKESVESNAVKQSIDCFRNIVEEQLLEKIDSYKEFKALKRENSKVCSMIRAKTQRLMLAKHELIRAERQVGLLLKEKDDLRLRLEDLRKSQAFLKDIRQINKVYLEYRTSHPKEKETYSASSPALLLESRYIQGTQKTKEK